MGRPSIHDVLDAAKKDRTLARARDISVGQVTVNGVVTPVLVIDVGDDERLDAAAETFALRKNLSVISGYDGFYFLALKRL